MTGGVDEVDEVVVAVEDVLGHAREVLVGHGVGEMPVDLMVMQRSCSSWRVSVRRASPAFSWAMIPAAATRESVGVDLPC